MRSPRSRGAGRCSVLCAAGALCFVACTKGVGKPLVLSEEYDGGHDAQTETPLPPMDAAMPTTPPKDASGNAGSAAPRPPTTCDQLDAIWSDDAEHDADKLIEELNKVRGNPDPTCGRVPSRGPYVVSRGLECIARLRLRDSGDLPPRTGNSPAFSRITTDREIFDFQDRLTLVGYDGVPIDELVITNANSAQSIIEALPAHSDTVCDLLTAHLRQSVTEVGAARRDHAWVVVFAFDKAFMNPPGSKP